MGALLIEHALIIVTLLSLAVCNMAIGFIGLALAEYRAKNIKESFVRYYKKYESETIRTMDQGSRIVVVLLFANAGLALSILFLVGPTKKKK